MAEIINFRRAKKAKARQEGAKAAEANRAKFGVPQAERDLNEARKDQGEKHLAAHKLDSDSD